jgi:polyhydroxyalkanoate synthesis regulator phasin
MAAGNASGIRAGRAYVELGADDKLSAALDNAKKKVKEFGDAASAVGAGVQTAGLAIMAAGTAIVGSLAAAGLAFAKIGSDLNDLSARTGMSVEALSELQFVFAQTGVEAADLESGIKKMQKAVVEAANGSQGANDTLARLGLSIEDLAGMTPEEMLTAFAQALSQVTNPTERAALSMEIFGKAGTKLLPVLAQGGDALLKMRESARAMGLTVSTEAALAADELDDSIGALTATARKLVFEIGSSLAPTFLGIVNVLQGVASATIEWIRNNRDAVVTALAVGAALVAIGAVIATLGGGLVAIGAVISATATLLGFLASAWGVVTAVATTAWAAMTGPVGLVIAGVAAIGATLLYVTGVLGQVADYFGQVFSALANDLSATWGGVRDALAAGDLALAGEIALQGLKVVWLRVLNEIKGFWNAWVYDLAGAFTVIEVTAREIFAAIVNGIVGGVLRVVQALAEVTGIGSEAAKRLKDDYDRGVAADNAARERELQDRIAALESERAAATSANQAELDAARAELDRLRQQAADARKASDEQRAAPPKIQPPEIDPIELKIDEPKVEAIKAASAKVEKVDRSLRTAGTFNFAAAAGLVGPSEQVQQRIAIATQATATNTRGILDAVRGGTLVWA